MRAGRAGQAVRERRRPPPHRPPGRQNRGRSGATSYARYPHYPQAESAWSDSVSVTASIRGRDDPPATEESLPSHSPGGCLARSSDLRLAEADGRAADEAAAMRTMAGLPFSGCDGGRLREAPIRNRNGPRARPEPAPDQRSSDRRNGQAGHRIFGSRTSPAESEVFEQARCHRLRRSFGSGGVGQDRVSARELRTRRNPGLRLMDRQAEPRLRPRILPNAGSRISVHGHARARKRNASSESAERRTARASALTGSPRGNPKRLRPRGTPEDAGPGPVPVTALEKAHRERPAAAEPDAKGTVGAGSDAGPHYCLGRAARRLVIAVPAGSHACSSEGPASVRIPACAGKTGGAADDRHG